MDIDWRTVQLFIGEEGISEVQLDSSTGKKVRCNCQTFQKSARCKHQRWVKKKMMENNGVFTVTISDSMDEELVWDAMQSQDRMREFIIHNTPIEVIE
jgi:hypothetical protein